MKKSSPKVPPNDLAPSEEVTVEGGGEGCRAPTSRSSRFVLWERVPLIVDALNAERERRGTTRLQSSIDLFIFFNYKLHSLEMGYSGSVYLNAVVLFTQRAGMFGDWALSEVERL